MRSFLTESLEYNVVQKIKSEQPMIYFGEKRAICLKWYSGGSFKAFHSFCWDVLIFDVLYTKSFENSVRSNFEA